MSELLAQAVDICRKLIGEKNTPEINEIEAAITNITYMPLFKDIDQSILKDMLLSLYTTKVDTFQILEGKERREPWLKAFKAAQLSKWSFGRDIRSIWRKRSLLHQVSSLIWMN